MIMILNIIDLKSHDESEDDQIEDNFNLANEPEMCALNDFIQRLACRAAAEMQILGQIASGSKLWPELGSARFVATSV